MKITFLNRILLLKILQKLREKSFLISKGLELGVAETALMKVIAQTTGRTLAQVRTDAKETGDLGLVAEQSKSNQRMMFVPAPLTVSGVFAKLTDIAKMTGTSVGSFIQT